MVNAPKLTLAGVVGAAAAALLLGLTRSHEGVRLAPYSDSLAGNVATVCFGETGVPIRRYTLDECKQILATSLAGYAEGVRAATPGFDDRTPGQKAAAIDLAYNVGLNAYRNSTLRKRYAANDFPDACDEFLKWRYAGGMDCSNPESRCTGIWARRQAERSACRGD